MTRLNDSEIKMNFIAQSFKSIFGLIFLSFIFIFVEAFLAIVFSNYFGVFDQTKIFSLFFFLIYSMICFFVFPAALAKFLFKESLSEMGLKKVDNPLKAGILVSLFLFILIPYIIFCAHRSEFHGYSLGHPSLIKFGLISISFFPLYYFAEEFFFRGFLFISFWKKVRWHSFWITDIIFTFSHIGKPGLEILLCIPVSVMLNILTLSTRSIYPAVIVHSTLGILLSFLTTYKV